MYGDYINNNMLFMPVNKLGRSLIAEFNFQKMTLNIYGPWMTLYYKLWFNCDSDLNCIRVWLQIILDFTSSQSF